ncbi:MAG TPA: SRPBCC family protein, partial [Gemmataceae bacterium]|nr:SRPBCC family protein [Gemmataceae bacterium]
MTTDTYVRRTRLAAPAEEVFRWHTRPGAFERLTPPWDRVEVVERTGGLHDGGRVTLRVPVGPFRRRWVAEHFDYQEGKLFRDRQLEGPFASFEHTHRIEPDGPDACWLEDQVVYTPPLGSFGHLVGSGLIRSRLERTFAYRHRVLADDLAAHRRFPGKALHVLVSGSHGLVGSTLVP